MEFERLTKTVRVADSENWYNQDTVDVSLFVTPPYLGITTVRILITTIDDFMVAYDHECYTQYGESIKWIYNHMKQWMYDKMPEEISLGWLYEHGYLPD
jgi:hypothetical protein